jgi:LysM repeat protein
MTAVDPSARAPQPAATEAPPVDRPLITICPYLAAADGAWRSTTVAREHRCGAVTPPAPLAAEKQRRLCLTADHDTCVTYHAARAARPTSHRRAPTLPRPLARTTPFVLDHGRIAIAIPALGSERSTAQAVLIGLLGIAFAAIVLARVADGGTPAGIVASSGSPGATVPVTAPNPSKAPTARPAASAGAGSPAAPSTGTGGSPAPAASGAVEGASTRSYTVKSGDTLIGIAARFGTTYQDIIKLNGIKDPSTLRVGQVIKIP